MENESLRELEFKPSAKCEDLETEGDTLGSAWDSIADLAGGLRDRDGEVDAGHHSAVADDLDGGGAAGDAVLDWLDEAVAQGHAVHSRGHVRAGSQLHVDPLADDVVDAERVGNSCS